MRIFEDGMDRDGTLFLVSFCAGWLFLQVYSLMNPTEAANNAMLTEFIRIYNIVFGAMALYFFKRDGRVRQ